MATNPKKTIDPTEAALSAIQEALSIRIEEERAKEQPIPSSPPLTPLRPQRSPSRPPLRRPRPPKWCMNPRRIGTRDLSAPSARPANDDQQSIGQILQALQRRPARTPYFIAGLFSTLG